MQRSTCAGDAGGRDVGGDGKTSSRTLHACAGAGADGREHSRGRRTATVRGGLRCRGGGDVLGPQGVGVAGAGALVPMRVDPGSRVQTSIAATSTLKRSCAVWERRFGAWQRLPGSPRPRWSRRASRMKKGRTRPHRILKRRGEFRWRMRTIGAARAAVRFCGAAAHAELKAVVDDFPVKLRGSCPRAPNIRRGRSWSISGSRCTTCWISRLIPITCSRNGRRTTGEGDCARGFRAWDASVRAVKKASRISRTVGDPESNLYATIPWGDGRRCCERCGAGSTPATTRADCAAAANPGRGVKTGNRARLRRASGQAARRRGDPLRVCAGKAKVTLVPRRGAGDVEKRSVAVEDSSRSRTLRMPMPVPWRTPLYGCGPGRCRRRRLRLR